MRGSKEEERLRSPMFPRLNVSDTEKPGQKAPPRNKMALYEQLTLPSQKFGSGNSESSGHAGAFERSVFTSFCNSSRPSHSELRTKKSSEEQKAINFPDDRSLSPAKPFLSGAKCSSVKSHNSGPIMHNSNSGYSKDQENQPQWNLSFSKGEIGITNLQARESTSTRTAESRKISNHAGRSFSFLSNKTLADTSASPSKEVLSTESLKEAHQHFNKEKGTRKMDPLKRFHCVNDRSLRDFVGKNDAYKVTNESFSKSSYKDKKRSHNYIKSDCNDNNCEGQMNITTDDVVKVLGEKQFWKARKAMVDQQRTFRLQVFELHRLLKVQKMIAQSPDIMLQDKIYSRKSLPNPSKLQKSVCIETNRELTQQANPEWWVPPPRNQWLVPVISPSEGLVYKPCTAPCQPNTGYMSPVCGPPGLTSGRGDFLNPVYGVPASHQGITGFVMPVMTSGSAVDQGSCNMSSQMSRTVKCSLGNFLASKETEIQGSTKEYTLPLFPTEPTSRSTDHTAQTNEKLTRVIKVVPHNRKLAPESAARIFQSITEERKQCC